MTTLDVETSEEVVSFIIEPYKDPVSKLLNYGEAKGRAWPNYLELGLTKEDIPELIRMATDEALYDESEMEWWATVHAWRTLGQLQAEEAIEPLLKLFEYEGDDYINEELPIVYGMIGPIAVPIVQTFFVQATDRSNLSFVANIFEKIAKQHPEHRIDCIEALTTFLQGYRDNPPALNGALVADLIDLQAVEAASVIKEAYDADCVDIWFCGFWEDVALALGVITMTDEEKEAWKMERHQRLQKIPSPFNFLKPPTTSEQTSTKRYLEFSEHQKAENIKTQSLKSKQKRKATKAGRVKNRKR
jgi:hypothetical protein